jgi:protein-L-isoaspartate O-methyltransferase
MDENRLSGTARNPHGQTQQAEESVQELYGQAKEAAGEAIHAVGKMPASAKLRYTNVEVQHGDGTLGWPDAAPFDAILVAAGGPEICDASSRSADV